MLKLTLKNSYSEKHTNMQTCK